MITKVKGEAIKEGSIPYSALATEVKEKIDKLVNITYANLKSLRDNSQLIPGQQYRITDYITTTTQENTLSAGHQFDVIVTADSENTLNESARACCKSEFVGNPPEDALYIHNDDYTALSHITKTEYNGKKYELYHSVAYGNGEIEILVDFDTLKKSNFYLGEDEDEYEYGYCINFYRFRTETSPTWGNWVNVENVNGYTIAFKTNLAYFADSDLNAWELKYSLDNDITRFYWAQEIELSPVSKRKIIRVNNDEEGYSYIYLRYPEGDENGEYAWVYDNGGDEDRIKEYVSRGEEDFDSDECIYTTTENPSVGYSIDEYNTVIEVSSTESGKGVIYYMKDEFNNECPYDFKNIMFRVTSDLSEYNYYTFNRLYNNNYEDDTIDGNAYNNVIKPYIYSSTMTMYINNIRFGHSCYNNTFGYDCYNNTFGYNCYNNSFGNDCSDNKIGESCHNNILGNDCYNNSFGYYCEGNILGNDCDSNKFVYICHNNILGNDCSYNSFGNYCEGNIFDNSCEHNSFGNYCDYNSFGNDCCNNTLGDYCNYNSFGVFCKYNIFGASKNTLKSYYRNIIFDNGNSSINLYCTGTTSSKNYYQNVRIGLGVNNTTITDSNVGQTYETLYRAANSQTITI